MAVRRVEAEENICDKRLTEIVFPNSVRFATEHGNRAGMCKIDNVLCVFFRERELFHLGN